MHTPIASALCLLLASTASSAAPPRLETAWTLDGLAEPESVAADPSADVLYVSNVAGAPDGVDGNGFISTVSPAGALIEREWVKGLNAPKGLAIAGGTLYVSDITDLVVIDVATRRVTGRHPAPGAKFLNDVAIAPDGRVLVSDSGTARIYAWNGSDVTEWLAAPELRSINGLLPQRDRLIVTTMQGLLLSADWNGATLTTLARDLGDADGVVQLDDGAFLVSEWPGRLFHVAVDGASATTTTVLDVREEPRYINDFIEAHGLLLVPHMRPGALRAYRLR